MSIRILLCVLLTAYFSIYAWRNYFVSLCAAILAMAIMQHPDVMENLKAIGGIPGLNLWNILIVNITFSWLSKRRAEGFVWDMPKAVQTALIFYIVFMAIAGFRLLTNLSDDPGETFNSVIGEDFINCFKWIFPFLILYDSCRTRRRIKIAAAVVMILFVGLAAQVVKHVPLSAAVSSDFDHIAYKMVQDSVGYNRVTLSMMLGGASWGMLALLAIAETPRQRYLILGGAGIIAIGQALTGGRSGYISWFAVGVIMGFFRWRKILIVIPVALIAVAILLPAVRDRMLHGIGIGSADTNTYEMTSGRNIAWPYVLSAIGSSPIFGYGREAMVTTGIYARILRDTNNTESFPHPHNAYLQVLIDSGILGLACVVPFYFLVLKRSFSLFLDRDDPLFGGVGGMTCALVVSLLVAGFGGETFYPREGAVGMWAAMGLMLRVWQEREYARESETSLFEENAQLEEEMDLESVDTVVIV